MNNLFKKESYRNGIFLGALVGISIIYGYLVKEPILNFITNTLPEKIVEHSSIISPVVLIGLFALIGYIVDRT